MVPGETRDVRDSVRGGSVHLGLVIVKGLSPEDSPNTYLALDVAVWRHGAPSGPGGG
ncbi:serine-threonine kinase-like protein [Streptomyces laurentii]|uniref:Serine-threonine kinase-like protein n=1 Tax=Streptomyces laurentii TaxID=39478 RepID=A0A169PPA3_STRLU|nr:serine-threonine kinase-like protein [Streptomyces laurentii]